MKHFAGRLICTLVGLLGTMLGLVAFLRPDRLSDQLGVSASNALGANTIAADFPSFFLTGAIFAFAAAVKGPRVFALVPITMFGLAAVFRILHIAMHGSPDGIAQPLGIEIGAFTVLILAYNLMNKR